jgi:hypothetical protein
VAAPGAGGESCDGGQRRSLPELRDNTFLARFRSGKRPGRGRARRGRRLGARVGEPRPGEGRRWRHAGSGFRRAIPGARKREGGKGAADDEVNHDAELRRRLAGKERQRNGGAAVPRAQRGWRRLGLGFCEARGSGCGSMGGNGRGTAPFIGVAAGSCRAGPRCVGRRGTAGLGRESEPSSSLRMGPTSGSHLAAREEEEKRGKGGRLARGGG